jgi:hypothetical protein
MPDNTTFDTRAELLDLLLEKVERDRYPSDTMLDMIEGILTPDDVPRYAQVLMAKISEEQFPSIPMIRRLESLA